MLINRFLGIDSVTWALQKCGILRLSRSPATIHYFPRVTFCDMERYIIGQVEHDTFQCVLMLNVINEKLFLMLWYWIVFELLGWKLLSPENLQGITMIHVARCSSVATRIRKVMVPVAD
uniref:Innexin n=1 Tax=Parascaris equorum TaxID=6256 RepID=A0A914R4X2_PAREQ